MRVSAERRVGKRPFDGGKRRLGAPLAIDQPEIPVMDLGAATPPLVGPRIRHRAARAFLERRANVHGGDCGLTVQTLTDAVGARFRQQQRLRAGDVLEVGEIRPQLRLAVQVDVERQDVEGRQIQIARGRIVDVREQRIGRGIPGVVAQGAQEPLDPILPVPPTTLGGTSLPRANISTAG